ncbi:GFA family protein [Agrobacterium vitis]|nr:GFA family protein [Agrobacterium vitis]
MCKRSTGSPFAVLVRISARSLAWKTGAPLMIYRSSPIARRGFCSKCGSPLFLQYDDDGLIRLTVGTLDHPERMVPTGHYGVEGRLAWAVIGVGLPEEETQERF